MYEAASGGVPQRGDFPFPREYHNVYGERRRESGFQLYCDLPQIEGATGRFLLQQMASVAELEAGMISDRTKKALAAAKRKGTKLGGFRGKMPTAKARRLAVAAIETRAANRASDLAPVIAELQAAGATSLRAIADGLNVRCIPTARGSGEWSAVQVMRVLERLDPFREEEAA
jgi:resolvase-like protein